MTHSRRNFIRNTAFAAAGVMVVKPNLFAASKPKNIIGVQLYSVRTDMKANPIATLEQLAKIGYKHVEHAYYIDRKFYGYAPTEFKKILDGFGLQMPSGHSTLEIKHWDAAKKDFTDEWKYTVEDAATAGMQYVISAWLDDELRKDYDSMRAFTDVFNKSGELCNKYGMKFGYHNHNFEFAKNLNGYSIYEILLEHTDPSKVFLQLDMGNIYGTGADPIAIVKNNPGRFLSVHVKDEIKATEPGESLYESCVLGKGFAGTKAITDVCASVGGTTHFIVEQESYQGQTPLNSVKQDLAILKSWGY
jgi:sugar phosphate isomerase/epimerase